MGIWELRFYATDSESGDWRGDNRSAAVGNRELASRYGFFSPHITHANPRFERGRESTPGNIAGIFSIREQSCIRWRAGRGLKFQAHSHAIHLTARAHRSTISCPV